MKLIALKSIGRLRPGDEFDVKATEARVLKAIGKAKDAPQPAEVPVKDAPRRRVAEPEAAAAAPADPAEPVSVPIPERAVPRFYRRRDMQPEDGA